MKFLFKEWHDQYFILEQRKVVESESFYEFKDGYFNPCNIQIAKLPLRSKRGRFAIKEVEIFATESQKNQIKLYASTCVVSDDLIEISKLLKFKFSSK